MSVSYSDGSVEIGGILRFEAGGYWVTVPAEEIRRWVPEYAVSKYVSSSVEERETSGANPAKPDKG